MLFCYYNYQPFPWLPPNLASDALAKSEPFKELIAVPSTPALPKVAATAGARAPTIAAVATKLLI